MHTLPRACGLAILICATLGACGGNGSDDSDASTRTATTDAVGAVAAAVGGGTVSVKDLPPFARIYPGASIISNMKVDSDNQIAGNVNYSTKASVPEIVAFYKKDIEQNGLELRSEFESGETYLLAATNEDRGEQLNISIFLNSEEDKRMVMMSHGVPRAETAATQQ